MRTSDIDRRMRAPLTNLAKLANQLCLSSKDLNLLLQKERIDIGRSGGLTNGEMVALVGLKQAHQVARAEGAAARLADIGFAYDVLSDAVHFARLGIPPTFTDLLNRINRARPESRKVTRALLKSVIKLALNRNFIAIQDGRVKRRARYVPGEVPPFFSIHEAGFVPAARRARFESVATRAATRDFLTFRFNATFASLGKLAAKFDPPDAAEIYDLSLRRHIHEVDVDSRERWIAGGEPPVRRTHGAIISVGPAPPGPFRARDLALAQGMDFELSPPNPNVIRSLLLVSRFAADRFGAREFRDRRLHEILGDLADLVRDVDATGHPEAQPYVLIFGWGRIPQDEETES